MAEAPTLTPWWKSNTNSQMGKPTKAWTPDPTRYHPPDTSQDARIGSGGVGGTAMIPRANNDGTSKGFDASRAGVFTIDPDKPGGGIAIDPTKMNNRSTQDALARVGQVGGDSEEEQDAAFGAYLLLGKQGAETSPDRAVVASEADERPAQRAGQQNRSRGVITEAIEQAPLDDVEHAPAVPQPVYQEPRPVAQNPLTPLPQHPLIEQPSVQMNQAQALALMAQIVKMAGVSGTVAADPPATATKRVTTQASPKAPRLLRRSPPQPELEPEALDDQSVELEYENDPEPEPEPVPIPRRPAQISPAAQNLARNYRSGSRETSSDSINSLKIDFLNAKPTKPTVRAVFRLGANLGTMQSRFHGVIKGAGCLILVYDTRYEDGSQWSPPNLGANHKITVDLPESSERHTVISLGIEANIGALDFTILIVNDEDDRPRSDLHQGANDEDLVPPM